MKLTVDTDFVKDEEFRCPNCKAELRVDYDHAIKFLRGRTMDEFMRTQMGQKFFCKDVPRIADALEKIADALTTTTFEKTLEKRSEAIDRMGNLSEFSGRMSVWVDRLVRALEKIEGALDQIRWQEKKKKTVMDKFEPF